jgi:hypothetical protein
MSSALCPQSVTRTPHPATRSAQHAFSAFDSAEPFNPELKAEGLVAGRIPPSEFHHGQSPAGQKKDPLDFFARRQ